jgi:hypothetical protein
MTIFDKLWGKLSRMHVQFDKTVIWNIFYFWTMRFNDKLNNILEILTWRPSAGIIRKIRIQQAIKFQEGADILKT